MALFGRRLGLAFQILDDVLDLDEGTGKQPLKDLHEGTFTLPVLLARGRDPSIDRLLAKLAATPREERSARAAELAMRARRAGGVERARAFARSLALRARKSLLSAAPAGDARDALVALNDELVARTR
jgi:geranylgeranyl pyrophosphate synthase